MLKWVNDFVYVLLYQFFRGISYIPHCYLSVLLQFYSFVVGRKSSHLSKENTSNFIECHLRLKEFWFSTHKFSSCVFSVVLPLWNFSRTFRSTQWNSSAFQTFASIIANQKLHKLLQVNRRRFKYSIFQHAMKWNAHKLFMLTCSIFVCDSPFHSIAHRQFNFEWCGCFVGVTELNANNYFQTFQSKVVEFQTAHVLW